MSWIKIPNTTSRQTCPGIKELVRPTIMYVKCHACGGDVEVWSDEDEGICVECGTKWRRPDDKASCLEYCKYAEHCREIIQKKKP